MAKKQKHEIEKMCVYCELAQALNNSEKMLCSVKGVVSSDFCCKKFIYDPLKRDPKPAAKLPGLDPDTLIL